VSILNPNTRQNTTIIATREGGTALVIFGNKIIIAMVKATRRAIMYNGEPESQVTSPFTTVLNCSTCDMKIMTASPFTKPNITGCGTRRINLPSLKMPIRICKIPVSATAANTYSKP
jgi:hypothetical protein